MDDSLRALERQVLSEPADDAAACAFLAALARATEELPPVEPIAHGERSLLGPLLGREAVRVRSIDPALIYVDDTGTGWIDATSPRGNALFAATLRLRLMQLDHFAEEPGSGFVVWAFHAALDMDPGLAFERLSRVLATGEPAAAERVARLLAARSEADVGRRLAALLLRLPSERRPRIYGAIAAGRVPIDVEAREALRASIARELGPVRRKAFDALSRGATAEELARDRASGPPEVRARALEALVERAGRTDAEELIRHGLADPEPVVRRAALQILATPTWIRHPRAADWAMNRLVDKDLATRHEALKLVRRAPVAARQLPRLRLLVEHAPPGIRPGLQRLLEHHERRAR